MMRWVYYILGICLVIATGACQNDAGTLGLRYNTPDKTYSLVITDTASLQMSTVLIDSLPTSNMNSLLIGRYQDPKFGKIESKAYMQIGLTTAWNPTTDLVFDSMVLVMKYSHYHYGDTTQSQSFEIREVTQDFVPYNLSQFWIDQLSLSNTVRSTFFPPYSIYNRHALSVDEVSPPLGTFTLKPRPSSTLDSITVRLRDDVGRKWLAEAQKSELSAFDVASEFLRFFKGFCIRSTSVPGANIIGIASSNFVIRLYYKGRVNELITGMHRNFSGSSSGFYNYNNITADRSGTLIAGLSPSKKELSSKLTGNQSYVEAGVGLFTKVTFTHIMDIARQRGFRQLNTARLIIEPVAQSYDSKFSLPRGLVLLSTDNANIPLQSVSSQVSTISIDGEHGTTSAYVFDVTQYVQVQMASGGPGRTQNSLLITLPTSTTAAGLKQNIQTVFNATDRLCIQNDRDAKYRSRLEVIYLVEN